MDLGLKYHGGGSSISFHSFKESPECKPTDVTTFKSGTTDAKVTIMDLRCSRVQNNARIPKRLTGNETVHIQPWIFVKQEILEGSD
jgi:hypothetical protein